MDIKQFKICKFNLISTAENLTGFTQRNHNPKPLAAIMRIYKTLNYD